MQIDGQIDITKPIAAFSSFANTPKIGTEQEGLRNNSNYIRDYYAFSEYCGKLL
jgi:hypothetical protein